MDIEIAIIGGGLIGRRYRPQPVVPAQVLIQRFEPDENARNS